VNIGGTTLNYTADGTETATDLANHFIGQINALGLEGVGAAAGTNAGELDLSNINGFTSLDISVSASSGTADIDIETLNGTATGGATTGTIEQRASKVDFSTTAAVAEGDSFKVTVAGQSFNYIAGKGESFEDVAKGLKTAIDSNRPDGVTTKVSQDATTGQWALNVDDDNGDGTSTVFSLQVSSGGTASGGLFGLDNLDVTTNAGATSALDNIETMIQSAIDAASGFGSVQGRIETQSSFISNLTDALKTGIGTLVDADMEEASAKLQALQVQQQLGIQSLSIANQAPQSILSLFR
jgi:flagellin